MRRWLAIVLVCAGSAPQAATVAVFTEPDFPFYIASPDYGPEFAAACLRQAGIECDEVAAAALADPAAFNAAKYRVLVQAYGNSFPVAAADNVRAFHAGGGCILALGGVPFCHPCTLEGGKWVDRIDTLGWNWIGHDRIGTGLWGDAAKVEELAHAAGDPLGLGWLPLPPAPGLVVQFPRPPLTNAEAVAGRPADDPRLLPEDTLTPVVSAFSGGKPAGAPVAIVHHHCPQFRGALDIWAGCTLEPSFTRQQAEQVVVASCAYLLRAAGAVDEEQRRRIVTAAKRRYVAPVSALPPAGAPFILRGPLPAKRLSVLDGTDMDAAELTCTLSLQGIVNRRQPRIYVIGQFQDRDWIEVLGKQGITGEEMASLEALLDRYRNEVAGAVITDPALPDTANIATMLAGLKHALVATPELAARLTLKPVMDLRGRWESGLEAYEWALRELWPKLKPRALACMAPSWAAPRDYLVQFPIFTFWLDCRTDKPLSAEQGSFFERVLASLPPRTAVYGWWQEGDTGGIGEWRGVHVSSQYGKITVCTVGAHNLSVHAGMPLPKPFRQLRPPAGGLDRKVYVSFLISDGDNFGMNLYAVVEAQWRQRMRGRVPVGWGICPTQVELTPALMDYWYRTASPMDEFIAMDGLGYIYPDDYGAAFRDPGAMLDDFLLKRSRSANQKKAQPLRRKAQQNSMTTWSPA
ncbi:MAG: hypothetical protein HYU66_14050 [Armatimonadetes bacterium]|nr:hypothetical protein [Armatimonadota bacterium]